MPNTALPDISEYKLRLVVSLVGFFMPVLVALIAWLHGIALPSISNSYWATDASRNVFVGSLFAISAILFAYQGSKQSSAWELRVCRMAAVAALGVALFPECNLKPCDRACMLGPCLHGLVHYLSAAVMFATLAYLCRCFWQRAHLKRGTKAKRRAQIYLGCMRLIVACMLIIVLGAGSGLPEQWGWTSFVYCFETLSLLAFALAWGTASKTFAPLVEEEERIRL